MIGQDEMFFVTARITISLPFRTSVKEGDRYEVIEKTLNGTARLKIYPLEYAGTITPLDRGNYVSNFRKIRMDVTLPVQSKETNFSSRDLQRPFLDIATHYLNMFLAHCRTKSMQFWLHPIYLTDFNMSQIWYEVQFVANNSEILYEEKGSTGGLHPAGVGINKEVWDKIKNDIVYDIGPNIVDYHIEEARTAIFSKSVEILIINIAVALEIFTSRFCLEYAKKIGKETDICFKSLSESKDAFTIKNFKKLIPYLVSKDLSAEDKNKYQLIDFLFRTRNKIVHEGKAFYRDDSDTEHIVDYDKSHEFFLAAIDILKWMRKIDDNIAEQLTCFIDIR
jgi:hypothetical protein